MPNYYLMGSARLGWIGRLVVVRGCTKRFHLLECRPDPWLHQTLVVDVLGYRLQQYGVRSLTGFTNICDGRGNPQGGLQSLLHLTHLTGLLRRQRSGGLSSRLMPDREQGMTS